MENPLTTIPILTDENYLQCSFWNISKTELKKVVKEFAVERSKNKRNTGQANHLNFELYNKISEIWTGFKRINSTHFSNGSTNIHFDAFDPKFGFSRFDMG